MGSWESAADILGGSDRPEYMISIMEVEGVPRLYWGGKVQQNSAMTLNPVQIPIEYSWAPYINQRDGGTIQVYSAYADLCVGLGGGHDGCRRITYASNCGRASMSNEVVRCNCSCHPPID